MNLKELAGHLSLSPTTVSRALNGYPEVSEITRARVRRAAADLNYRPRHQARQLATGRSLVLGHVVPRSLHALIAPLFSDLLAGAGDAADELGYDTHFRIVDDAKEEAHYREIAASRRVDGVVLHGPLVADPRIALLADLELPFIVHGRSRVDVAHAWLDVDNAGAMRRATALLLDLGHRDVALVNGPEALHFAHERRAGYLAALDAHGIAPEPSRLFSGPLAERGGHDAAAALLDGPRPPSAFACAGLLPAWGVLRAALARGLVPGRDVSIVAYDDGVSWLSNRAEAGGEPPLTAVRGSLHEAGRRLVHHLAAAIDAPGTAPAAETLPVELVLGASTGPPARRRAPSRGRRAPTAP